MEMKLQYDTGGATCTFVRLQSIDTQKHGNKEKFSNNNVSLLFV